MSNFIWYKGIRIERVGTFNKMYKVPGLLITEFFTLAKAKRYIDKSYEKDR